MPNPLTMAIFNDLGLEVRVLVNGSPTSESVDTENDEGRDQFEKNIPRSSRYIELISAAELFSRSKD